MKLRLTSGVLVPVLAMVSDSDDRSVADTVGLRESVAAGVPDAVAACVLVEVRAAVRESVGPREAVPVPDHETRRLWVPVSVGVMRVVPVALGLWVGVMVGRNVALAVALGGESVGVRV